MAHPATAADPGTFPGMGARRRPECLRVAACGLRIGRSTGSNSSWRLRTRSWQRGSKGSFAAAVSSPRAPDVGASLIVAAALLEATVTTVEPYRGPLPTRNSRQNMLRTRSNRRSRRSRSKPFRDDRVSGVLSPGCAERPGAPGRQILPWTDATCSARLGLEGPRLGSRALEAVTVASDDSFVVAVGGAGCDLSRAVETTGAGPGACGHPTGAMVQGNGSTTWLSSRCPRRAWAPTGRGGRRRTAPRWSNGSRRAWRARPRRRCRRCGR